MARKPKMPKRPKRVFPFRVEVNLTGDAYRVNGVVREFFKVGRNIVFTDRPFLEPAGSDSHAKDRVDRSLRHYYPRTKVVPYYSRDGGPVPNLRGPKPRKIVPYKANIKLTGQPYSVGVKLVEYYKVGRSIVYIDRTFFKAAHSDEDARARVEKLLAHCFPAAAIALNYRRIWPKGPNPYQPPRGVVLGVTHPIPKTK